MTPPECKTCGKRTDLSDQYGYSRCRACRRMLFPGVYVELGDEIGTPLSESEVS